MGALVVILIAAAGCTGAPAPEVATPTPLPTPIVPVNPTYRVQRGEVVRKVQFTGRIEPLVLEELFFRTSGFVGAIHVDRGEWVEAGDLLAEIETHDLQNQLAQAKAELEAEQLRNEQRIAEAEENLRLAEMRLSRIEADTPDAQVTIARVALERAQTALEDAQEAYQVVLDQPWLPDPERALEAATRRVHEAELTLEVARAEYHRALQARSVHAWDVQIQEQEVERARRKVEELEVGIDVKSAQLTVSRLEAQLADAQVVAPFDGLVLSVSLVEGSGVEAYKPVMTVGDPAELEVSAYLPGTEVADLAERMPATIVLDRRPGEEISGHIRRLPISRGGAGGGAGAEDRDTYIHVALDVAAAEAGFELGDIARVTVMLERRDDVLWLPPPAIRTFEGRKFVVIQEGDAQRRVDVKVGIQTEDRVEIEEGLTEGQVVIGQ